MDGAVQGVSLKKQCGQIGEEESRLLRQRLSEKIFETWVDLTGKGRTRIFGLRRETRAYLED